MSMTAFKRIKKNNDQLYIVLIIYFIYFNFTEIPCYISCMHQTCEFIGLQAR